MGSFFRYLHTPRHLRAQQVVGRVWFKIALPGIDRRDAPKFAQADGPWVAPIARPQSYTPPSTARFLGVEREVATAAAWNDPRFEKLWLYNLHYFDDLSCEADSAHREAQRSLIARWISENPPPKGNGWEPYPTSLRIVNWIKWGRLGGTLDDSTRQSLAVQARWLMTRTEWHILANHLFVNGKALVYAGLAFEGRGADRWLRDGLAILAHEVPEQILADGGHFEGSPMYHAIILEDLLDLVNAARAWPGRVSDRVIEQWIECAQSMIRWLDAMTHPDGGISFFNDAALSIAPKLTQLRAMAQRLSVPGDSCAAQPIRLLPCSGYARASVGPAELLCDLAPVGPDYQPGHAHADTLSFELSLFGDRIVVNTGTSTYAPGPLRTFERSTKAHNTLEINGADSSEVWGAFRVARRARVVDASCRQSDGGVTILGAHDGYTRLRGAPIHRRRWLLVPDSLTIFDTIDGAFRSAVARVHLHPSVTLDSDHSVRLPSGHRLSFAAHGGSLSLEHSSWHPEFGSIRENLCLVVSVAGPESKLVLRWT